MCASSTKIRNLSNPSSIAVQSQVITAKRFAIINCSTNSAFTIVVVVVFLIIIHWLSEQLIDRLTDWKWLMDQTENCLTDWPTSEWLTELFDSFIHLVTDWLTDHLTVWLTDCLIHWPSDSLSVDWLFNTCYFLILLLDQTKLSPIFRPQKVQIILKFILKVESWMSV